MGCRRTLPWDYFLLARDPTKRGGDRQLEIPGYLVNTPLVGGCETE
jgi:hypothetical protein